MPRTQVMMHQRRSFAALPALMLCLGVAAACSDSTSPHPEGQQLAFASDRGGTSQIFVVNEDGTGLKQLTHQEAGADAREPAWSPDGSRIAFTEGQGRGSHVVLMHSDGSHHSPITVAEWGLPGRAAVWTTWSATWSPDTAHFAVVGSCAAPSKNCMDTQSQVIVLINVDGFVSGRVRGSLEDLLTPAWSPDGQAIAYAYEPSIGSDDGIWVFRLNDRHGDVVSRGCYSDADCHASPGSRVRYSSPAWAPDAQKLAYVASTPSGDTSRILVKAIDESDDALISVTPPGSADSYPSWSPDGSRIAFTSLVDGYRHIFVMNSDGSERRQLTDGHFNDVHPTWSPRQ